MRTVALGALLRQPAKIKRITRGGESVLITDNRKPLWIIRSATTPQNEQERARAIDALLDQVASSRPSGFSLSAILDEERR